MNSKQNSTFSVRVVSKDEETVTRESVEKKVRKLDMYLGKLKTRIRTRQVDLEQALSALTPKERAQIEKGLKAYQLDSRGEGA